MNITLPPDLEDYVARCSRKSGYGSPDAVMCTAVRRMMEEEHHEQAVLDGLRETPLPLTQEDLSSVRSIVKEARAHRPG